MLSSSRPDPTPLRARLAAREAEIARLSAQVAALRETLRALPPERREAVADSARERQATSPRSGGTRPWRRVLPYAAIAAAAIVFELNGRRAPAPPAPDSFAFARPAAVAPGGVATAPGAPLALSEDDRAGEALLLVQEWTAPGDSRTLLERFGEGLPGAPAAWSVERTGEHAYRVSARRGAAEAWEFDADLDARTVTPAAETAERLAPAYASLRDALRD
jgi:hypothetical protein